MRKAVEVQLYTHMYVCSAGVFRGEWGCEVTLYPIFSCTLSILISLAILFFSFEKGAKGIQSGVVQGGCFKGVQKK